MRLTEQILQAGADNCLFLVPMYPLQTVMGISFTSSNDEPVLVPAVICEERYKVKDGYKITLKPLVEGFATEHYYALDLSGAIKSGYIQFFLRQTP